MAIDYAKTIKALQAYFEAMRQEAEGSTVKYYRLVNATESGQSGVTGVVLTATQKAKAGMELAKLKARVDAACKKYNVEPIEED